MDFLIIYNAAEALQPLTDPSGMQNDLPSIAAQRLEKRRKDHLSVDMYVDYIEMCLFAVPKT